MHISLYILFQNGSTEKTACVSKPKATVARKKKLRLRKKDEEEILKGLTFILA